MIALINCSVHINAPAGDKNYCNIQFSEKAALAFIKTPIVN